MKLTAKAGVLDTALSVAASVRASKNFASTAHFVATDDNISILCSDNSIGSISVEAAATVDESGQIAVSAQRIAALVSSFATSNTVVLRTTDRDAEISSGNSRSRLPKLTDLPVALALDQDIATLQLSCSGILTLLEPISVADDERTRSWDNGKSLDLFLARQPLNGADVITVEAPGTTKVAVSLSQLAAILNEFSCERIQLWSFPAEKQEKATTDKEGPTLPSDSSSQGNNK